MSIYDKLYDWQKQIVDNAKNRHSYGLFLDMGLGKTALSLALAEINKCTKILIITLNNKATEKETDKGSWLNWASLSDIHFTFKTKYDSQFDINNNELFIVNYESLFKHIKSKKESVIIKENVLNFVKSCKQHNVALIIDESHKLKNLQSQQTKSILNIQAQLSKICNLYTYLLTGTPFTHGYDDLYTQLKVLGCKMLKKEFVENFCIRGNVPGLLGWQQPIVAYKNVDKLFELLHQYAITIKSEDVIKLPKQIFIEHISNISAEFIRFTSDKLYSDDLIKIFNQQHIPLNDILLNNSNKKINNPFFRNIAFPNMKWLAETAGNMWLRARQLTIGFQGNSEDSQWFDYTRLKQLENFLKDHEDNYVLFYNYTPELLEIYDICDKLGYNIDIYCGEIKSMTFYDKYEKMTENERLSTSKNIILANFASGSTGKNWQLYNKCIIFSCPIYKDYAQGIKRIHRIGQDHTVIYHIFKQNNWLDTNMFNALTKKIDYTSEMFESDLNAQQLFNKGGDE